MTSESIQSTASNVATTNNVLLVVDAESLFEKYPTPSKDPERPTSISDGFVFFVSGMNVEKLVKNDSKYSLNASNENILHIRGRTVSLIAEHSVVFYDITVGESQVLSPPKLQFSSGLNVPAPNPEKPVEPGNHQADDYYWECTYLNPGVAALKLCFMIVNQQCDVVGYFSWEIELTLSA
ncbi:AidA/PixA family protein [Pseudomonas sp. NPDC087614]|uniref:AidA/PixA family protein n=1 Tax=Pseudomonas sp. NPDC087614 TaxID=3364442 RepID=UPI0038277F44